MNNFNYSPIFPVSIDETEYIKISDLYVKTSKINNEEILIIGFSHLALRLYKFLSPNINVRILYSQREYVDFKKQINDLKNYKLFKIKNIENYIKNFDNSKTVIF